MSFAAEEFQDLALGDRHLDTRALAANSMASIPQACGRLGADPRRRTRFLAQDDIDWQDILAPHWQSAEERMRAHAVVLGIQDTHGVGLQRAGDRRVWGRFPTRPSVACTFTPSTRWGLECEPLGVLDAWMWAREPKDTAGQRGGPLESSRWVEGHTRVAERAAALPNTRLVYLADREAARLMLFELCVTGCLFSGVLI